MEMTALRIVGTEGVLEILNGHLTCIDANGEHEVPLMTPPDLFADCLRMIEDEDYSQNMDGIESTRIALLARKSADQGGKLLMKKENEWVWQ